MRQHGRPQFGGDKNDGKWSEPAVRCRKCTRPSRMRRRGARRSRFWMAGPHIAVRNAPGVASRAVRLIASRVLGSSEATARNLLVHCAQEMNHLAGFLPELYDAFGNE